MQMPGRNPIRKQGRQYRQKGGGNIFPNGRAVAGKAGLEEACLQT